MADSALLSYLVLLLLAIGGIGGFLSGLLGVGGGIIFVPALFFTFSSLGFGSDHAMHVAVGSSLAVVLATSATSAFGHYKRGAVDMALFRSWGSFIASGVVFGALFASAVHGKILKEAFAVITFIISIYMAFGRERTAETPLRFLTLCVQRFLCAAIGMVSSMIGVGGAILTVPMMSGIGLPMQRAVGTGAALGTTVALPGMIGYMLAGLFHDAAGLPPFSLGYVNMLAIAAVIPASMLLAPVGVRASHAIDRKILRRVFAAVLMIVSARMFFSL